MVITDEMIEAAARAIQANVSVSSKFRVPWDKLTGHRQDCYRIEARAALEAALSIKNVP